MILFINRLLSRIGGSYLSNNDLINEVTRFFDVKRLLLIDYSWSYKGTKFNIIPEINKHYLCFQELWKSDSIPTKKILSKTIQNVMERSEDQKGNIIILGHESLVWLVPFLKNELQNSTVCIYVHNTVIVNINMKFIYKIQ